MGNTFESEAVDNHNRAHMWRTLLTEHTRIACHILQFLPFHESFRLRSVNNSLFNQQLLSPVNNAVFTHFELYSNSLYCDNFHGEIMRDLCNYARDSLVSFRVETLDWFQKSYQLMTVPVFNTICEVFTNLRTLALPMCSRIGYHPDHPSTSTYSCIVNLRRLPNLQILDLSGCNITDYMMSMIAQCRNLTELNLRVNKFITDAGIKALFQNDQYSNILLKQLKTLDLSYTSVTDEMFQYTLDLQVGALHNLEQLHVMNTKITSRGIEKFFSNQRQFLGDKDDIDLKLQRLNLFNCPLPDLSFLTGTSIDLESSATKKKKGRGSRRTWNLKSLKGFCMHWNICIMMDNLSYINQLQNLRELVICDLKKWNAQHMEMVSNLSNLETLSIRCERIDRSQVTPKSNATRNAAVQSMIKNFPRLKKIDIHVSQDDIIQQKYLQQLCEIKTLEYIHLQSAKRSGQLGELTNAIEEELRHLSSKDHSCQTLKYLALIVPNYSVSSKGLCYLTKLSSLVELNVRFSNSVLRPVDGDHQENPVCLPSTIQSLSLEQACEEAHEQLSAEAIGALISPLNNLQKLVIQNQNYQSSCVTHSTNEHNIGTDRNFLKELPNTCPNLVELRLDLNCCLCMLSDKEINLDRSLQHIKHLTKLEVLGLSGAEGKWTKNTTILPLSKTLKNLIHLHLPQFIIDQISQSTFQRLFPNTVIFGPNGPTIE